MAIFAALAGVALIVTVLWDAFETIILPRRVTRRFRLTRLYYRDIWLPWSAIARRMRSARRRESYLSYFGPLSLLGLFGVWAAGLILGFAMLHWSLGSAVSLAKETPTFWIELYLSGTTFFTLGLGDVVPRTGLTRGLTVVEAGTGFGFLAIVISYLPVLYGAFSRREANISLLDARAGSPPTAAELLRRQGHSHAVEALTTYLRDWELWSAELMESHLSYPVLCFYRSQHSNQSWLAALTAIMDTCVLILACAEGELKWQAQLTFAISRHALVDLAQILSVPPRAPAGERLPPDDLARLRALLAENGVPLCDPGSVGQKLDKLRPMYEPYLSGLTHRLLMPLPPWIVAAESTDNWRTSAWGKVSVELAGSTVTAQEKDGHF
jgi:hypothetical protein